MPDAQWFDLGPIEELERHDLRQIMAGRTPLALSFVNGEFSAISGVCNHVGGPLGEGILEGEFVKCPWHNWKFHHRTGDGEPGSEEDRVPSYETKIENGHLFVNLTPRTPRHKLPHPPHRLARAVVREPGPIRVVGISSTVMDARNPRYSASDDLLQTALRHAAASLGAETRLVKLNELAFRACEGYYSKSAQACTWPCSITQMDDKDQMEKVYEALVHWGDVVLVASPIRWGAASSLYYKMVERLNCVQNQLTIRDRLLIRNKVAAFIIVGGQDNIQAVAGQMLSFFSELGFVFPQFPYIAHSRGWSAEDLEQNVIAVQHSRELHEGAEALAARAVELAKRMLAGEACPEKIARGGRKAHREEPVSG